MSLLKVDQITDSTGSGPVSVPSGVTFPSQTTNKLLIGPYVGSAAAPTFRTLGAKDRPLQTRSMTSAFSIDDGDDVVFIGSGSFSVALPPANIGGRILTFYKFDSYTNIQTIQPAGGDTIGNGASTTLNTFGETITIVADGGTNWAILHRTYDGSANFFSATVVGTVSNPSTGTLVTNTAYWRRTGDSMYIKWQYEQSTAGSAGSGKYLFLIPSGLSIDSSYDVSDTGGQKSVVGVGFVEANNGASNQRALCHVHNSTSLGLGIADSGTVWDSSSAFNYGALNTTKFCLTATVKILGWHG